LPSPAELERLRAFLDQQLEPLKGAVSRLANKLQRRLQAQQNRSWAFDREEGILDAGRLARVVANPTTPLSFKVEKDVEFRDTVVTLLLDNSGSMRGRPISIAAVCADVLARTLERCSVKVEILGFTTRAWKGGTGARGLAEGWPPGQSGAAERSAPHRLQARRCALAPGPAQSGADDEGRAAEGEHRRRGAGMGASADRGAARGAQDPDGDLGRRAGRRFDPVGEPVELPGKAPARRDRDDREETAVELLAIGIGHDVTRYYGRAVTITDAEQLAGAITDQLAALFDIDPRASERAMRVALRRVG
jgi:cobaltochelatase CobT